ncbi:MAG: dTDP-4-dehydrorhamnose 3,5-epimerase [Roseibium sp.]|uniref:dTDP-4-dehydrorhamnose 3,5-epimerase n=1 Tax=Roseibium sp. TaxID=1936156 RepID=UPI00262ACC89|nr:dTDP-4-dehydrorhamnose 3,5-epimerase [Roseibium sp.]MCV0425417.1 dTDP-4-dehydrorhamnose 3,5-epimerase [Roseibium sp.]
MKIEATEIADVLLLVPECHADDRGLFAEVYNRTEFVRAGISPVFTQDNMSRSVSAGTVRGLHYQVPPHAQAKLVRCSRGAILDVAVDIRRYSPTFGRHVRRVLSADNMQQLFVPAGFAHGFSTLSANTEVQYKVSADYAPDSERGIAFDDPTLAIDWQLRGREPILSAKDRALPFLENLKNDSPFKTIMEPAACVF